MNSSAHWFHSRPLGTVAKELVLIIRFALAQLIL